ncbi:helix-turn-helix domain-containing protein [Fodinibius sp.]|uniref:helix-turn-helix domain-containing protein n=1 Tax=Fodinibius sp. TaxID=1872440 RepID=UPI002ACEFA3E|nr:helix-turn-helix domain-containing protein [Fodinibius sp.]MDZ7659073.1 helix-turn-helix domain-containing protein [Fodinibius sp.]
MPKQIGNLTLYSVDDLHEQLGLSKMTIRAYLREGKIRARKLGVKWYVTEEALREYFNESSGWIQSPEKETQELPLCC